MNKRVKGVLEQYNEMVARSEIMFDELQVNVLRSLESYARGSRKWWKFWRKHPALPKRGVYLHGDVGRGKSLVANLFYEHCGVVRKRRVHFNTLMRQVHDLLHLEGLKQHGDADQMLSVIDALVEDCSLLYLDEMQVRDVCEAVILHRVFRILFAHDITILMTSNYHPSKLYEDGIQRELFLPAIDLIMEKMEVISLSGKQDYREVKGLKYSSRFYIGQGAAAKLREHFYGIAGDNMAKRAVVVLGSRSVDIGIEHEGVVFACFDDLCGSRKNPLWAADYKEIARRFHTIFIEGIPVFDYTSQNEMHRFIVLIDELYERKSRLFCSLATEIGLLYDGIPTVDIKRAMSRLKEMNSEAW